MIRSKRLTPVAAFACAVTAAASSLAQSAPSPSENWMVYGGDYTTWSAMETTSIRKEGPVAFNRQVVFGQKGPLKKGAEPFDYVVLESAYDCVAKTSWSVRAHFYDRAHKVLWTDELNSAPRSTQNSSPAFHFMPVACDGASPPPNGFASIPAFTAGFAKWMVKPEVAVAP